MDKSKEHADVFVKEKDYPAHFTMVLDPDCTFTNASNLRWKSMNETTYPSTFVIDGKRKVLFAKTSTTHGDRAKTADVLTAGEWK